VELVNQYPQEFDASIPFLFNGSSLVYCWRQNGKRFANNRKQSYSKVIYLYNECGLDKVEIPMDIQQAVFEKTVDFGTKYNCSRLYIVWLQG
jgi:TatD DNase family protein